MRRLVNGTLGVALVLTGCQVAPPGRVGPSDAGTPATAMAVPPGAKPSATAGQPPAMPKDAPPPLKLDAPATGTARLAGQVRLDPAYALRGGAGAKLVGQDGATLVGMDGATLAGGSLLDRGGRVMAQDGARFAVPAGLIGMDGSTLIGQDGSTLIGNDGSTLIGNDGSTYRLAQAAAAPDAIVPAAGMWVSVVDTRTGFTVPIGTAGGQPVYTLYTDAQGGFEAHPPADVAPYARIVARAPGQRDPNLVINLLTRAVAASSAEGELAVDPEAAATSFYLRHVFGARLSDILVVPPDDAALAFDNARTPGGTRAGGPYDVVLATFGKPTLQTIQDAWHAVKPGLGDQKGLEVELSLLMADKLLTEIDLGSLKLTASLMGEKRREPGLEGLPVLPELHKVFTRLRKAARAQIAGQADPAAFFAAKPWLQEYNLRQAPEDRVRIEQAEDLVTFLVRTYMSENNDHEYEKLNAVLHDLYASLPPEAMDGLDAQTLELQDRDRLRMGGGAFSIAFVNHLFANVGPDGQAIAAATAALIRQVGARMAGVKLPARPVASIPPLPAVPPPEPTWIVETVAGKAYEADVTDGPGAEARFKNPYGLWADPVADPPVLYVADGGNGLIRKLAFDAAGQAMVTTVGGVKLPDPATGKLIGAKLAQDGGPNVGCFVQPLDVAMAPDGKLYVVDAGMHALRRLNLDKGPLSADVETLAGSPGEVGEGTVDAAGRAARFSFPTGLLLEAGGSALVADSYHFGIRRVGLTAPFPVTTVIGGVAGNGENLDGPLKKADGSPGARQDQAYDVARAPDGALWLVEGGGSPIRRIAPDGKAVRTIAGGQVKPEGAAIDQPAFGLSASFDHPWSIAVTPEGDAIVADTGNHRIRRVRPDGWVLRIAGSGAMGLKSGGYADGAGDVARFDTPRGVAIAPDGSIFVSDDAHTIRRLRRR